MSQAASIMQTTPTTQMIPTSQMASGGQVSSLWPWAGATSFGFPSYNTLWSAGGATSFGVPSYNSFWSSDLPKAYYPSAGGRPFGGLLGLDAGAGATS